MQQKYASPLIAGVVMGNIGMPGRNNGAAAVVGVLGEVISSQVLVGSAVSLTTATAANITSITLTPGLWLVFGQVDINLGATSTVSYLQGGSSLTSGALGAVDEYFSNPYAIAAGLGVDASEVIPTTVRNVSVSTTLYLTVKAGFAISTAGAYGKLIAIRVG